MVCSVVMSDANDVSAVVLAVVSAEIAEVLLPTVAASVVTVEASALSASALVVFVASAAMRAFTDPATLAAPSIRSIRVPRLLAS